MYGLLKSFFNARVLSSGVRILLPVFLVVLEAEYAFALKPDEILIIANGNSEASVHIANYYCQMRGVPEENILHLALNHPPKDTISRASYQNLIARPVRASLSSPEFSGKIKCLLTVYGVPFRVGPRGMLNDEGESLTGLRDMAGRKTDQLKEVIRQLEILSGVKYDVLSNSTKQPSTKKILKELDFYVEATCSKIKATDDNSQGQRCLQKWLVLYSNIYGKSAAQQTARTKMNLSTRLSVSERIQIQNCMRLFKVAKQEKWGFDKRIKNGFYESVEKAAGLNGLLLRLNADIDNIKGVETGASVDSELSMVMFDDYELYHYQPNELKDRVFWIGTKTLMVSRLDGPGEHIAKGLIDKAIRAERDGLKGVVYIDWGYPKQKRPLYEEYDESLRRTASMLGKRTDMKVVQEQTTKLFASNDCPNAALYCGWYSLKKYIDAFEFVDGAVGYHIASWEAIDLRDSQSSQWCPAMLTDGITATIGAVAEPYLTAFPKPHRFFTELVKGKCLAEAFYRTKPFNSWQMVLIGDPLYRPFE